MGATTPDGHLTWYVINYFGGFMTKPEWLAYRAFAAQEKDKHAAARLEYFRENDPELYRILAAEKEQPNSWDAFEDLRTSDPEALALMKDGYEQFARRVRDGILREHRDEVFLNYCPKCGGLANTPKAKQCRSCFYDWRPQTQREMSRR